MEQKRQPKTKIFESTDLKLSALLLSEIPGSHFEILLQSGYSKKTIKINYPETSQTDVDRLISEYINRTARVSVSNYNRNLNTIRDHLKGRVM